MEEEQKAIVGVDIVDNRYVLCILDFQGMHPRYYKGRVDTSRGQAHFFAKAGNGALIIPSGNLAVLALKHLGEKQVVIKDEKEHYAVWAQAGIERGQRMARFAALLLYAERCTSDLLCEKERMQLLLLQEAEIARLLAVVQTSQLIQTTVLNGNADDKTYSKAVRNEQNSRQDLVITGDVSKLESTSPFADGDTSFLAKLYRELKTLH